MADPFIGEIRMFAGSYAPRNYVFCNGDTPAITQYNALFSIIGTAFGGNGTTNFGLPDLRGRTPCGIGGQMTWGKSDGFESVYLSEAQIPSHSHGVTEPSEAYYTSTTDQANHHIPNANTRLGKGFAPEHNQTVENYLVDGSTEDVTLGGTAITSDIVLADNGAGFPHQNMQPFAVINYIIAVIGSYPPRS